MTLASETLRASYAGNGSTVTFAVPFRFLSAADLRVLLVASDQSESPQTLTADYSVSGAGADSGGSITFVTAPTALDTVLIIRDPERKQPIDFSANPRFDAGSVEAQLDRLTMIAQRQQDLLDRAPIMPDAAPAQARLPVKAGRANKLLGFDADGNLGAVANSGEKGETGASGKSGPHVVHSFPDDNAATGVGTFVDAGGQRWGAICYGGKASSSLEIYKYISGGVFETDPTATADIPYPEGLTCITDNGKSWIGIAGYRGGGGTAEYDRTGYIFEFASEELVEADSFACYGVKRPEFSKHSDGTLRCFFANSVSSSRNTSGNPAFANCGEQSIMVRKLTGSSWGLDQEFNCGMQAHQALPFEYDGDDLALISRYYDTGVVSGGGSVDLRYRARSVIVKKVAGSWSLSNVMWSFPTIGASSAVPIIKDGRLFVKFGYQRNDAFFGGNDKFHFNNWSPVFECLPHGRIRPVNNAAVIDFNAYMVRTFSDDSNTFVATCNGSSGGAYPTNFNEGVINITRFDERSFTIPSVLRVQAKGVFDATFWKEDGGWFCWAAEGTRGEDGTYSNTIPSRVFSIGSLEVMGSEEDDYFAAGVQGARNRMVNSAVKWSQRNGTTAGSTNLYWPADRWRLLKGGTLGSTFTAAQVAGVTPGGSSNCLEVNVSSGGATGNDGYAMLNYSLEGREIEDLRLGSTLARAFWLRFYFKGPAGTYSIHFASVNNDVHFLDSFVITADEANTDTVQSFWVQRQLRTIGSTWATGSDVSAWFRIVIAAGTDYHASSNGWVTGLSKFATSAITDNLAATGTIRVGDFGLYADKDEAGVMPDWEMPDPAADFAACQRHYQKHRVRLSTTADVPICLPVTMRVPAAGTAPTCAVSDISTGTGAVFTALATAAEQCSGIYQSTAHSVAADGTLAIEAGI